MENDSQESSKIARVILDGATRLIKISADIPRYAFEMVHILQTVQNGPKEGQVKMRKMMETGSALKVIPLKGKDNHAKFAEGAKQYGVMYSVVEDTQKDIFDIVIREEDAPRVNRIIERYEMRPEDIITVRAKEMMDTMANNQNEQNEAFAGRNQNNMDMRNPSSAPAENLYGARSRSSGNLMENNVEQNTEKSMDNANTDNIIYLSERGTVPRMRNSVREVIKHMQKEEEALGLVAEKTPEYIPQQLPLMRPSDAFDEDLLEEKMKDMRKALDNFNEEFRTSDILQNIDMDMDKR